MPSEFVGASVRIVGQSLCRVSGNFATVAGHVCDRDGLPAGARGSGGRGAIRLACRGMATECERADVTDATLTP